MPGRWCCSAVPPSSSPPGWRWTSGGRQGERLRRPWTSAGLSAPRPWKTPWRRRSPERRFGRGGSSNVFVPQHESGQAARPARGPAPGQVRRRRWVTTRWRPGVPGQAPGLRRCTPGPRPGTIKPPCRRPTPALSRTMPLHRRIRLAGAIAATAATEAVREPTSLSNGPRGPEGSGRPGSSLTYWR